MAGAISCFIFAFTLNTSCSSKNKKQEAEVTSENNAAYDEEESKDVGEELSEDEEEDLTEEERKFRKKFVHPHMPDAWHTNKLIMTKPLPDRRELNKCREDLKMIGTQLSNDEAMVLAVQSMGESLKKKTLFYHWCFYYSASSLDWGLANETKRAGIQDQLKYFHENMRGLFILARALDKERRTKKYFFYARTRYIELSRSYFGRELEPVLPPVDVLIKVPKDQPKDKKPADKNSKASKQKTENTKTTK